MPPEDEADLVALADGCLYGPRRAELERRLAVEPELADALEGQQAALSLLNASYVPAPLSLRLRVEELQTAAQARRRWRPAVAAAFAAALSTLVILFAGSGPAVADVLPIGLLPATAPAVPSFAGVQYPAYEGWKATGSRHDVIDGRDVQTVFYSRDGRTIAYAIVDGPALSDDGSLRVLRSGGQVAVTWTRAGRTCVIVGVGADADALARLAVW